MALIKDLPAYAWHIVSMSTIPLNTYMAGVPVTHDHILQCVLLYLLVCGKILEKGTRRHLAISIFLFLVLVKTFLDVQIYIFCGVESGISLARQDQSALELKKYDI